MLYSSTRIENSLFTSICSTILREVPEIVFSISIFPSSSMIILRYFGLFEIYEDFLEAILKLEEKPKRVIDVGSNMNQYAYTFENAGIDYIGIDVCKHFVPYESEHVKFIWAKYEDIADLFKDDILISDLCVNYLVKREDVKAKHLFTNSDFTNDTNIVQWW